MTYSLILLTAGMMAGQAPNGSGCQVCAATSQAPVMTTMQTADPVEAPRKHHFFGFFHRMFHHDNTNMPAGTQPYMVTEQEAPVRLQPQPVPASIPTQLYPVSQPSQPVVTQPVVTQPVTSDEPPRAMPSGSAQPAPF